MTEMLSVDKVKAGYGRVQVLNGISVRLGRGENIGLFGPNGHGKTTLLRVLSGLVRVTSGTIRLDGVDLLGLSPWAIVELGLIHVPQGNLLFPNLTVAETLQLGAHRKLARAEIDLNRARVTEIFPKLAQRWGQRVSTLSGGERQMVSVGMALMNSPKILLLDEPTLGLSPKLKDELGSAIGKISAQGIPLVIVEQDIEFLLELTKRLYMVSHGETTAELTADNRPNNRDIMEMYFGT
ncbi:MAG TPA: ABC transporter ATP-binding protein [Rhizobiaceae bacterium]|nr:ABC transporter ATP-binding protein [Rhizobiaceae bacterium]